jgi:hypothetical protein
VKSKKKGYNPSDYLAVLDDTPTEYSFLSAGKVFNFQSKYPIFLLNCVYKNGTWQTLKRNIEKLEKDTQAIKEGDVEKFLGDNLDIDFELGVFDDILFDSYYFLIDNKMYCYCLHEIGDNYIMARFFFDIKEFIC